MTAKTISNGPIISAHLLFVIGIPRWATGPHDVELANEPPKGGLDSAQMNAMGRKYPFGQKMKRRGHFHIGAHNTKYILPVCTQKVKHICTKIKETSGNFPAIWQTPGRAFSLTTEKPHDKIQNISSAGVVELVDSVDLGSSGIAVQVRVLSPAPKIMATRMGSHYFWSAHHTGLEPIKCPGPVDPGCSPAGRGALLNSIESCHPKKGQVVATCPFFSEIHLLGG